jgi:hypothetical protein
MWAGGADDAPLALLRGRGGNGVVAEQYRLQTEMKRQSGRRDNRRDAM